MSIVHPYSLAISGSLPSRGAWIEISLIRPFSRQNLVAPLAGSVDRNTIRYGKNLVDMSRSPRGERG